jgi:hypothetical protein
MIIADEGSSGVNWRVLGQQRVQVDSVQVDASGVRPVMTQSDPVGIQEGNHLENVQSPEHYCDGVVSGQK